LLQCVLFEKYIHILALEMAGSGNQHCADSMGTVLVPCETLTIYAAGLFDDGERSEITGLTEIVKEETEAEHLSTFVCCFALNSRP